VPFAFHFEKGACGRAAFARKLKPSLGLSMGFLHSGKVAERKPLEGGRQELSWMERTEAIDAIDLSSLPFIKALKHVARRSLTIADS
jgi:hypothetical protein